MKCTWVDCTNDAAIPQIAKDGEQWANLCVDHDKKLAEACAAGNAKLILAFWVKAQGGAKAAAERM